MKKYFKHLAASMTYYTGAVAFAGWMKRLMSGRETPVILMYHRVLDDPYSLSEYTQAAISVSTKTFEQQMRHLSREYRVLPLSEVVRKLRAGEPLPKKCAAITFDDGWRDNYTLAYPILKKYNLPATIFLTTDFIGTGKKFWFLRLGFLLHQGKLSRDDLVDAYLCVNKDAGRAEIERAATDHDWYIGLLKSLDDRSILEILDELERRTGLTEEAWPKRQWTLSWEDISDMDPSIIEYGSHGQSHRIMLSPSEEEIRGELLESKAVIESRIGRPVASFAYPNGDYNDLVKRLVQEAGYQCALSTHGQKTAEGNVDLFALRRVGFHEGATEGPSGGFSEPIFACILAGIL